MKLIKKSIKATQILLGCVFITIFLLSFYFTDAHETRRSPLHDPSGTEQIPAGHLEKYVITSDRLNEPEGSHRLKINGEYYFWCSPYRIIDVEELSGPSETQPGYTYQITESNRSYGSLSTDLAIQNKGGSVIIIHSDIKQSTDPNDWN